MFLENKNNLDSLAKSLALLAPASRQASIPQDFLNLEGFRLSESPEKKFKVMFLGSVAPWGDYKVKLCPKLEWLFYESDQVVLNLEGQINPGAIGAMARQHIRLSGFKDLCEQIIPEKLNIMLGGEDLANDERTFETLKALKSLGTNPVLASEMVRLEQGLFLEVQRHACEIKAGEDLARLELGSGKYKAIRMRNKKMVADNLGSFISSKENDTGMLAQLEFALYDDWLLERVKWYPLSYDKLSGAKIISF